MSEHTDDLSINVAPAIAITVAIIALVGTIFAVGRVNAIATVGPTVIAAGETVAEAQEVKVDLTEFMIDPQDLTLPVGSSIRAVNRGAAPHNIEIEGTGKRTPDIESGGEFTLQLGDLEPGTYTLFCNLSGHRGAGMEATLTITGEGIDTAAPVEDTAMDGMADTEMAGMTEEDDASHAELAATHEEAMRTSIEAFPAQTEGVGAEELEPEVLEDGTKLFELTVSRIKWEVEPGKFVDAIAYNDVVPGPTMRVDVGDEVIVRVHNELEHEGTSLHPHGLKDHPFEIDGVTYVSQEPIGSGDSMDYAFVAQEESVVTYHSHHMSLEQVPNGLFGMMVIGDYAELAGFDGVVDEVPMIVNDSGNIGLTLNGKSFPATQGYQYTEGDRVLVHYANEGQMAHPMHLHNQPGTVIAKDGYLLPESARYQGDTFNVAPGERLTVVYEMRVPGTWLWHCHILNHVKRADGSMFGMLTAVTVDPRDEA